MAYGRICVYHTTIKGAVMMGHQTGGQEKLLTFNLEDHAPQDYLLRGIDRFLDLRDLRQHLADFYSHTGRPSIDPEFMIRMLIIGYCFGIRSERRTSRTGRNRLTTGSRLASLTRTEIIQFRQTGPYHQWLDNIT